jgi:hypothetical protein
MNEHQIDNYLLNLLSPEEKKAFESQLESDDSLREKVMLQQTAMKSIEGLGRIELKSKLQQIHQEVRDENNSGSNLRFLIYKFSAAAAFIGLILFSWLWINQSPSSLDLYAKNFEIYELNLNQRSGDNDTYTSLEKLYSNENYSEAIPLFQEILNNSSSKSSEIYLGLGISFLKIDQPTKAIVQFEEILKNKDFNFEDEARWYLGLAYLKLDDVPNAKNYFSILGSDSNNDHHKEAISILSQLD